MSTKETRNHPFASHVAALEQTTGNWPADNQSVVITENELALAALAREMAAQPGITEAQVSAWLIQQGRRILALHPGQYAIVRVTATKWSASETFAINVEVASGGLSKYYDGATIAEAFANASAETPELKAKMKRAEAAALLKQAEELEGTA